jgi:hypothetical protein
MMGKSKSATFTVENLIPYDCPIMLSVSSNCKSMFTLPFVQGLLSKDDLTTISVICTPTRSGTISTSLYLIAFGIQTFEIKMTVHCGNSLIILDNELKFGPTDIYFNGVSKNMLFKNLNNLQAAPVTFKCSSNEISFNKNKELILLPGETREVSVEFKSILSGNRVETVKIASPNNPTRTLGVSAFSGPEISVPVFEDIYFPPTIIGTTSYIRIPFTNIADVPVTIKVYTSSIAPLKFESLDPGLVNRKLLSSCVDSKPFTQGKYTGLVITILPNSTGTWLTNAAFVEIGAFENKIGLFKIPLKTDMIKPRKMEISSHFLYIAIFDYSFLQSANKLKSLDDFISTPFSVPITMEFEESGQLERSSRQTGPAIFKFVHQTRAIFGTQSRFATGSPGQFVSMVFIC